MAEGKKKYRFCFIPAFKTPSNMKQLEESGKKGGNVNLEKLAPLLEDVEYDVHAGALASYGDWAVENREEACLAAAARVKIVREVCESGKYNGLILSGGIEPGHFEAREIARKFSIPVTSCAWAQFHVATMLGNKFSIISKAESSNMILYNIVVQHELTQRLASIRNINIPNVRPPYITELTLRDERVKAEKGEPSEAVDRAVKACEAAIEEDGAEVMTFGCSALYWLQPFLQQRMDDMGWEIPVLDAYACTITLLKAMVDMGVDASGLMFPADRPKKWRRKKV
ncbi:aspartate/glutamate racemase family protein, partial [Chloroflexota bacterium]